MRCKTCHYSLANLTEHRCPECGNPFDPNDQDTFDPEPPSKEQKILFWLVSLGTPIAYWAVVWPYYGKIHESLVVLGPILGVLLGLCIVWFGWKVHRPRR